MRRALIALAVAGALGVPLILAAQPQLGQPVLHEDLVSPVGHAVAEHRATPSVIGNPPVAGRNPAAIGTGDRILPEPDAKAAPAAEEPVFGRGGFGADRMTQIGPDDHTSADSTLHYIEEFNPSVLPFKRMSAFDAVDDGEVLRSAQTSLTDLPVGGQPTTGWDRFWGTLTIELSPGQDVAIPSVAPDMRILSYETTPRIAVTFSKDGADNFYVRSDESEAHGAYRLVFLAEADARYFAPTVPDEVRVRDLDPALVRPMPEAVRRIAARAHRKLGLTRDQRLRDALATLVDYFRAFQAGDPPPSSGDAYWDLFDSQIGVCRHRSLAFMITANALGIPTRFVANEAHAFVEVFLPNQGWARIDLGGAAAAMQVDNAGSKAMYRPRGEDPFPKPDTYANNYTRLEGDVRGLTSEQIAEARTPRSPGSGDSPSASGNGNGNGGNGNGNGGNGNGNGGNDLTGPGHGLPTIPDSALVDKQPTRIQVDRASGRAFRGDAIDVDGKLTDGAGKGLAGLRVDIFLAPRGGHGDDARLAGHAQTEADGSYHAHVTLPRDLELGEHEVYAFTPGNTTYRPSGSK